jgi:xanthine/uracil permease
VGAVFLVICGMIATAGLRLLACGEKDEVFLVTTAISLIAALTLPLAAGNQKAWLTSLSPTAQLFLSNGVVIAITLGIVLNSVLRAALGREA